MYMYVGMGRGDDVPQEENQDRLEYQTAMHIDVWRVEL